ncbi:putative proline--tRNA ligase, mitochondrial [Merluccius polli]|uniref:Proline--tRNA ligase, mitochondrial n=1 Tax=Merluccius polli TaxID=89951 RepID=A0AA47M4A7_MERPO|nr:putative proline--tRNA ligase, mitochondrial [Merluccius polli]
MNRCVTRTTCCSPLGLRCVQVQADTGNIGGTLSHEFQLPADIGEDRLLVCGSCSFSANVETLPSGKTDCPRCHTTLAESKGIEVGHTFYLGTKYSRIFNATFSNHQNQAVVSEMGCYGLGVTRILAAAVR